MIRQRLPQQLCGAALSVEKIEIDPYVTGNPSIPGNSWYDVCYGWTMTPPEQWGGGSGTQETYTVTYDFNIPKDVNSIFPITDYGIRGNESSGSYDYIKNKVDALTSTKLEDQNFIVADGLKKEGDSVWHGFFGYKWNDLNIEYYYFDGWMTEDGNTYETGDTATASSALAGNDTEIKFTGVWEKVPKWTEEQLAKAEQEVPLDVFTRGENEDLLIAQSTDTLTKEERAELIKKEPAYGNIICRCEMITEGEIIDAIRRPLGAKSLDGVKRRTRAGMGRCQSGFCSPRTMEILARELGVSMSDITKSGGKSRLVVGTNKDRI